MRRAKFPTAKAPATDSLYELIKQFYDVSFSEFLDEVKP